MRPVQYFSDDYLAAVRTTSPDEVVQFLENFREMHAPGARSRLISMKVPEDLLYAFKAKAKMSNTPYQTQIKALMKTWVLNE